MKHLLKILLAFAMALSTAFIVAAETPYEEESSLDQRPTANIPITVISKKKIPRLPSGQQIDCVYNAQYIYLNFAIPEGSATITVEDLNTTSEYTQTFDSDYPTSIYIDDTTEAIITIDTDFDNTYIGRLIIP